MATEQPGKLKINPNLINLGALKPGAVNPLQKKKEASDDNEELNHKELDKPKIVSKRKKSRSSSNEAVLLACQDNENELNQVWTESIINENGSMEKDKIKEIEISHPAELSSSAMVTDEMDIEDNNENEKEKENDDDGKIVNVSNEDDNDSVIEQEDNDDDKEDNNDDNNGNDDGNVDGNDEEEQGDNMSIEKKEDNVKDDGNLELTQQTSISNTIETISSVGNNDFNDDNDDNDDNDNESDNEINNHEKMINGLTIDDMCQECDNLRKQLETAKKENESARLRFLTQLESQTNANGEANELKQELKTLKEKYQLIENENSQLKKNLENKLNNICKLENELKRLNQEYEKMKENMESQIENLEQELQEQAQDYENKQENNTGIYEMNGNNVGNGASSSIVKEEDISNDERNGLKQENEQLKREKKKWFKEKDNLLFNFSVLEKDNKELRQRLNQKIEKSMKRKVEKKQQFKLDYNNYNNNGNNNDNNYNDSNTMFRFNDNNNDDNELKQMEDDIITTSNSTYSKHNYNDNNGNNENNVENFEFNDNLREKLVTIASDTSYESMKVEKLRQLLSQEIGENDKMICNIICNLFDQCLQTMKYSHRNFDLFCHSPNCDTSSHNDVIKRIWTKSTRNFNNNNNNNNNGKISLTSFSDTNVAIIIDFLRNCCKVCVSIIEISQKLDDGKKVDLYPLSEFQRMKALSFDVATMIRDEKFSDYETKNVSYIVWPCVTVGKSLIDPSKLRAIVVT